MRNLLICTLVILCLVGCVQDNAPPETEATAAPETTYIKVFSPEDDGQFIQFAWTQNSVHLHTDGEKDFEPLFSPYLYEPYANSDEIIAAIRALGATS